LTSIIFILSLMFDIKGTVVDPMGMPVPDARVVCNSTSVITDSTGTFTIPSNETCEATITKAGFASQRLSVRPGEENKVALELASVSERVVVTATGAPVALEEAGVAASIITSTDLQVRNMNRVADVLREVPGLNIVQTGSGGGITSMFTRGGDSNATVVLMDGIPVTDPGGSLNLAGFSTSAVDRVEVVRGPESALFGAEAASGVLQIFTKRGDPEAKVPHGMVTYERGSFSTDHWTASVNGGLLGRIDYALTADQFRTTGQFPNNTFRNTTGTANIGYRFSDVTTLRGIFRTFDSFTGIPGLTGYKAYDLDGTSTDRDSAAGFRFDDSRGMRFSQRAMFNFHRLRTYSQSPNSENYQIAALTRTEPGIAGIPAIYFVRLATPTSVPDPGTSLVVRNYTAFGFSPSNNYTNRTSAGYQATLNHSGGSFIAGYDYERQAGLITSLDVHRRNNGVSLYDQWAWRQRIFVSGGARIENSNLFGWRFAPRGAITFRLPTETFLRLSLGRGVKQPTLLESFAQNPFFVGNPNLRPAITDSFEAGITREWFDRRVRTEFSYFRNRFTDLIQFVSDPVTFIGTWANVAKSRSNGFELSGTVRVNSFVRAKGSYTKLYSEVIASQTASDVGQWLLRRPQNSGTASLELTPRRWTAIIGARFVGESRDSFNTFGINRISPYNVAFLSASWQATKNLAPYVSVNNLFDEQYQQVSGYASWSRNALVGLRITW
jgi:vitamin B12 transporter